MSLLECVTSNTSNSGGDSTMPELDLRLELAIRPIDSKDLPEVLAIEATSFVLPWGEAAFRKVLRRKNTVSFVAIAEGQVLGFVIMEIFREHFQLLNLAVHKSFRRRGVGRRLLAFVADQLIPTKRNRVVAEVRESSLATHMFLQSCRYRATQILHEYYNDTNEDAYQFELRSKWPEKVTSSDKKGFYANKNQPE